MRLISVLLLLIITGCSTSQVQKTTKVMRVLTGGDVPRSEFLDPTVEEALQYEMRICMDGEKDNVELRAECVQLAYEKVKAQKGLNEDPDFGGTVTVEQMDEDAIIDESATDKSKDSEDNKE